MNRRKHLGMTRKTILYVGFAVTLSMLGVLAALVFACVPDSLLFRRVVTLWIPQSVADLKTDLYRTFGEHYYVFRFSISQKDLLTIAHSGGFTQLGYVGSFAGGISYGVNRERTHTFVLYGGRRQAPDWFDLCEWKDPAAYIVEEEEANSWYRARLLIYSQEHHAAYFVENEMRGHWGGGPSRVTKVP
jgi:hypothetical protein